MTFSTERRVEFRDTDMAGLVHFSAFFPMMEAAEHEMFRSLGMSVLPSDKSGFPTVTWPRVSAKCDYRSPAHFEDILRIDVNVVRIGTTSVSYEFRFSRDGQPIAEGSMTTICCLLKHPQEHSAVGQTPVAGGLEKTPIPDSIREQLLKHH